MEKYNVRDNKGRFVKIDDVGIFARQQIIDLFGVPKSKIGTFFAHADLDPAYNFCPYCGKKVK